MLELLFTALLLAVQEPEASQPARFELVWDAPAECPGVELVRARVDELLGAGSAGGRGVEVIVAEAGVVADGPSYVASLRLRSGASEGRRSLADPDCRELGEAVALIVALAVDPELMSRAPEPEPEPEPEQEPEPEFEPEPEPEPEQPDGDTTAPALRGFGILARTGPGFGVIAPTTGRVALAASGFGRLWRVELGASVWIPQRVDIGRFSIAGAELRGCVVPELGSVEFPVCAGFEAGAMIGAGQAGGGRRASAPWLAAEPGAGVTWVAGGQRLALGVRVDAVLPLVRPAFASDAGRIVVRAGFGAQVLAGVELRFNVTGDQE